MKNKLLILTFLISILAITGCKKFLDINSDPDTPQDPDVSSVFPTQLANIPRGLQFDGRFVGRYIQNWLSFSSTASAPNVNFDRMGYTANNDANGDIWRQTYFGLGKNLDFIIDKGKLKGQWDYVGAAYTLKAMMFQYCTDYHGEIVFKDAFKEGTVQFKYDDQETVYKGIDSLCKLALLYLNNTNYDASTLRLSKGDFAFNGNVSQWVKLTNGILARNFHRLTNKSIYNADSVIYYCDRSLATNTDDFLIPFDGSRNDDSNFYGTYRDNLTVFRQSNYIVKLLDGSILSGVPATSSTAVNRDPRLKHMLSCSEDTTNGNGGFRGVNPGLGDPGTLRTRVAVPWADSIYSNPSAVVFSTNFRRYLFGDKTVFPIMTSSEIQFMKAEAAFRKGDKTTAHAAYLNGINQHFDFINRGSFNRGNGVLYNQNPISSASRVAYLASANVKATPATLNFRDIMLQKYIALWGWGFFETWVDMRRFHYLDNELDVVTGLPTQVYMGFTLPTTIATENLGKLVYRVRPRFNSEYIWNRDELLRIGALNVDYHTYEPWFSQP
jgi:Starch-binding associating with outer membrane